MKKRYKQKLRACGLCKPHKRGMARRFRPKDMGLLELAEREILNARGGRLAGEPQ